MLEPLKITYDKYADSEKIKAIESVHTSLKTVCDLLENHLIRAQLQSKQISIFPQMLSLRELIERKNTGININIPEDLTIVSDRYIVAIVICDLLSNAAKFTPEEGTITFEDHPTKDSYAELMVSDTGRGMSENMLKSLFRMNRQIRTPGADKQKGTGLGLELCK